MSEHAFPSAAFAAVPVAGVSRRPARITAPPHVAAARARDRRQARRRAGRRRLALAIVAVSALVLLVGARFPASGHTASPAISYTVVPGDTLWSLARHRYGTDGTDGTRAGVAAIIHANGLEGSTLQVGQVLQLP